MFMVTGLSAVFASIRRTWRVWRRWRRDTSPSRYL